MITVSLIQGSPRWHAHRAQYCNASDSPAMMGLSPHKTRNELLHERYTGMAAEVDTATQRRFDDGHRAEALARAIAEGIIDQELYPVTGTSGQYSASFDGLTMDEKTGFEHKLLGQRLSELVWVSDNAADFLPMDYLVQMEHQAMVSGCERILFMASKWDENGNLIEERHCWYTPDMELRAQIVAGWTQFEKDLAAYTPRDEYIKPVAEVIVDLPALSVQTTGEIAIKSNLDIFGEKLQQFVKDLNLKPQTDQEFANADAAVKVLQNAQDALEAAEAAALAQASSVDEMRRTVAGYVKLSRDTRLMLEKVIKAEKENRKLAIINAGREAFAKHVAALDEEIKPLHIVIDQPDFVGATKGLKTINSLQDKVDDCLAAAKMNADATAQELRTKLKWFNEHATEHKFLFNDLQQIITKPSDDFSLLVKTRISEHQNEQERKLEEERERIRAEEEAKAKAQADSPAPAATASVPSVLDLVQTVDTGAKLKIGQINSRLGFIVNEAFLASLGFKAEKDRNASLYRECDFPMVCDAIARHVLLQANSHEQKKAA